MNNIVEYEACILGLETALELGIRQIEFLKSGTYLEVATTKDRRALRPYDERGSRRSLWSTHGRTHAGLVSDSWRSHSCTVIRVTRFDLAMAIFSMRSSAYRPQTNGVVEAANKNIKRILRKMLRLLEIGATPYPLVYGMEVVFPIETEMSSLRVALEQQISKTEWAQALFDQLNLLDGRRLRAVDHV
ncbi:hypothetical protein CK203_103719 [Vitis vinifera]|uniref:Integrase catalytic domain-containing protein n=1 Tax=Vitis vinifera TaxID=29760 RepID=A0A438D4F9_VITVI|nr:hypothetical protein CK203_103719 [Vitis vinifera]